MIRLSLLFSMPLLLALGACGRLYREPVPLLMEADCAKQDVGALLARSRDMGPRTETAELQCALSTLRSASRVSAQSGLLGSRICLLLATRGRDQVKRESLAAEGVRFAEQAVRNGGDSNGEVHYYLAANLGFVVRDQITLAMENLPRLRGETQRAFLLSPDVDDGGPLRLLGMLYLKAPPWPAGFGDGDKALELLREAAGKHPRHPLNRLFFAQAIREVEGDDARQEARSEWLTGRKLLQEGHWGYNREPWLREFDEVRREFDEPDA